MRGGRWLCASLAGLAGVFVVGGTLLLADSDPGELLLASEAAEQQVSYSGSKVVRVYRPDEGKVVLERVVKVWHRSPGQTRIEMVAPADSLGVVMVENGEELWMFHPRRQQWRRSSWRAPQARPQLLLRNYDVRLLRREPVAGRPTVVLRVTSRYPGNPSKTVWVDPKTKLALRHELYDTGGRRVSASEFREIAYTPSLPANLFTVPVEARAPQRGGDGWRAAATRRQSSDLSIRPRYVPTGYVLIHRISFRRGNVELAHLRCTDGLNTLTLFAERGRVARPSEGAPAMRQSGLWLAPAAGSRQEPASPRAVPEAGKTRAGRGENCGPVSGLRRLAGGLPWDCSHRLTWTRGGTRYTLVGNISPAELRRMAASVGGPDSRPPTAVAPAVATGHAKR